MAFWKLNNGFGTINPINKILESNNPTLEDLLKEHNLLHELTAPNSNLIEFLRKPKIMKQLIQYVVDSQPVQIDTEQNPLASATAASADSSSSGGSANTIIEIGSTDSENETHSSTSDTPNDDNQSSDPGSIKSEDEDVVMKDSDEPVQPISNTDDDEKMKSDDNPSTNNDNDNDEKIETADLDSDPIDEETNCLKPIQSHEDDNESSEDTVHDGKDTFKDAYHEEPLDKDSDSYEYNEDEREGSVDDFEIVQHNAHIASEILSADIWSITEALIIRQDLLQRLWDILDYRPPLSMTFTTCFTKINEALLSRITNEMLNFIKMQYNFVRNFTKHIDNPPLMDFLLKIISSDKPDHPNGVVTFLQHQGLILSFISCLGPDIPSSVQSAAGDFLKAFVAISANSNSDNTTIGPNELSRELVGVSCVQELVKLMLHGGTGLATGVGVVIEIIRKNNSDYDEIPVMETTLETHPPSMRDPICLTHLVDIFAQNIPEFHKILVKKHDEVLETPFGKIEPLGFERFKICELIAELLHCSNMALLNSKEGAEIVRIRDQERIKIKHDLVEQALRETSEFVLDTVIEDVDIADGESKPADADSDFEKPTDSSKTVKNEEKEPANKDLEEVNDVKDTEDFHNVKATEDVKSIKDDKDAEDVELENSGDSGNTEEASKDDNESMVPEKKTIEEKFQDLTFNEPQQSATESPDGVFPSIEMFRQDPVVGDKLKLALYDNQVIIYILNMFFRFPWNNFLHNVVFDIVQQVLNGPMTNSFNRYLAIDLFDRGRITNLICDGQSLCAEYQEKHRSRLGYMGHLTLISEEVVKLSAMLSPAAISPIVQSAIDTDDWRFYENHTLVQTREKYNTILGDNSADNDLDGMDNDTIIVHNGNDKPIELGGYINEEEEEDEYEGGGPLHGFSGQNAGHDNLQGQIDEMRYQEDYEIDDYLERIKQPYRDLDDYNDDADNYDENPSLAASFIQANQNYTSSDSQEEAYDQFCARLENENSSNLNQDLPTQPLKIKSAATSSTDEDSDDKSAHSAGNDGMSEEESDPTLVKETTTTEPEEDLENEKVQTEREEKVSGNSDKEKLSLIQSLTGDNDNKNNNASGKDSASTVE